MDAPKLYRLRTSGNSYKIRLLAALLDIKLEYVEVDFENDAQESPEFRAINPRGQMPVLVVGNKTFTDSAAILVYLAGTYPDPNATKTPSSFWSTDCVEQAAIVDWLAFATGWIQPGIAIARYTMKFECKGIAPENHPVLEKAQAKGHKSLEILQTQLSTNQWLALERPTIADVAVFAYVHLAPVGGIDLSLYPAVEGWVNRVRALPGFYPMDE